MLQTSFQKYWKFLVYTTFSLVLFVPIPSTTQGSLLIGVRGPEDPRVLGFKSRWGHSRQSPEVLSLGPNLLFCFGVFICLFLLFFVWGNTQQCPGITPCSLHPNLLFQQQLYLVVFVVCYTAGIQLGPCLWKPMCSTPELSPWPL